MPAEQGQDLAQERDGLAVGEAVLLHRVQRQVADPAQALERRVVVYDDGAVAGRMDVQFDPLGAQGLGATKGGAAVLMLVAGCTTVSDTQRSSHEVRMSGRMTIAARMTQLIALNILARGTPWALRPSLILGARGLNTYPTPVVHSPYMVAMTESEPPSDASLAAGLARGR